MISGHIFIMAETGRPGLAAAHILWQRRLLAVIGGYWRRRARRAVVQRKKPRTVSVEVNGVGCSDRRLGCSERRWWSARRLGCELSW